ncbi:hypothetical protein FEM48_Zijuj03G0159600 [Ziziphus jujuba var. spinosa]|uniref:Uncharacterized protein n=1 Tax=Ziziphus jujuba var. spinosa TaxID=714518 RepID=A0A978VR90_ZIZJJ|nr:hypothetical protein FEM48_Zijuj03G0159600 [Ziziphus jujuba var. spinosa]
MHIAILPQELEKTKTDLDISNRKLNQKEELAAAAQATAEKSLQPADSTAARLRERVEELSKQLEETESRYRNRYKLRHICWPWGTLKLSTATMNNRVKNVKRMLSRCKKDAVKVNSATMNNKVKNIRRMLSNRKPWRALKLNTAIMNNRVKNVKRVLSKCKKDAIKLSTATMNNTMKNTLPQLTLFSEYDSDFVFWLSIFVCLSVSLRTAKKEYKQNIQRDARALLFIQQGVSKSMFPGISNPTKSKAAWEILKQQFGGHEKVISIKLQTLWREFDNLAMTDNETIQEFFSRAFAIINQIRSYEDTVAEQKIVGKIFRCLPAKLEHIVAAIEESKDLKTYSLDKLFGYLEAHEKRMSRFSNQPVEKAFKSNCNITERNSATSTSNSTRGGSFRKGHGIQG